MSLSMASAPDVGAGAASLVPSSRGRRHSSRVLARLLNAYVSHPPSSPPLRLLVLPLGIESRFNYSCVPAVVVPTVWTVSRF